MLSLMYYHINQEPHALFGVHKKMGADGHPILTQISMTTTRTHAFQLMEIAMEGIDDFSDFDHLMVYPIRGDS